MRLPNVDRAEMDDRKLRDYLLSESHPVGRFKAAFFRSAGFESGRSEALRAEIIRLSEAEEILRVEPSRYGAKYVVRGPIKSPSGRRVIIVVVWMVHSGEDYPRFVTAYPG